ncbi:DUF885 family protein [Roseateles sp. YR242]|uniref:DUF885 domain-containing protein n=1 Tax=Roseateles sp. YR242 TaxID=1855305 RepID=UPI000B8603A9|nr:DUF885 domain-containing protein [Roseateles sp. YR242]
MSVTSVLAATGLALTLATSNTTAAAAVAATPAPASQAAAATQNFDAWAEGVAAMRMRADPMTATAVQYFSGKLQDRLDGELAPATKAAQLQLIGKEKLALAQLGRFDPSTLTPVQRVSAEVIRWSLERDVANAPFLDHAYMFDQMGGAQIGYVLFMTQSQPLRHPADVENYLKRLAGLGAVMDQSIARARASQAKGVLMPRFITEKTLDQFEQFLQPSPAQNVLVTALDERMAEIDGLSAAARQQARARAEKIVARSVLPAWRRGLALVRAQLPLTTHDAGVWRLPDGANYYAAQLRAMTTTNYTPAEVHAIGLAQVARIEGEMDGLLRQLGYADGTVNQRFARLQADQQPKEPNPQQVLNDRNTAILRDAEARAKLIFDLQPKARVEVRREPPLTEATAAAHYSMPAPDGSQPGIYWSPLPGPTFEVAEMRTTVYHETVPGHHFQLAIQQENEQLPRYRRSGAFPAGSAFVEGWALYAEQLAVEYGWYEGDPVGRLGQLNLELLRARRLVVDTGLHALKWTRQQAIDYGVPEAEVDRYVVWPGQACAYMIGRLKIEALRQKAHEALGERFDIKKFHNLVLLTGDVPLQVLEDVVDNWIRTSQQGG